MAYSVNTSLLDSDTLALVNSYNSSSSTTTTLLLSTIATSNTMSATFANLASLPAASANTKGYVTYIPNFGPTYSSSNNWYTANGIPLLLTAANAQQIYTWGRSNNGQLGNGSTTEVSTPSTIAGGGSGWTKIACADFITAAIKTDGTLWTWGYNNVGQQGDGTITNRSSPGTVAGGGTTWSLVASGATHTAAIKTDGTLWTWGSNVSGRLGDGTTTNRSSPGTTAGGGTNWSKVALSAESEAATAAIKSDGTLWTWGYNYFGGLGAGATKSRSSPGTVAGGGTTWSEIAKGYEMAAAIKTDGTLWTWGRNDTGQLGTGNTTSRSSPGTTAGGGTNWSFISCGSSGTMAAIKTDGTLWTWGINTYGTLGDGTTTNRSSPGTAAGGGTNWVTSSVSTFAAAATKTDGSLWTWGYNAFGSLGDGTTTNRSSPGTILSDFKGWSRVNVGRDHMIALLTGYVGIG